ncbi:MAG: riboflavin biosynthesis protein RibF [Cytophagales bacterium]|nr:riboflavin biosynthesis protein RibF [Cytophagales bacterium]
MRVYDLPDLPSNGLDCVLTVGNYDGLHRGHQRIIDRVVSLSKDLGSSPALFSFSSHPKQYFHPEERFSYLLLLKERRSWLKYYGIEILIECTFDKYWANLSAGDFVKFLIRLGVSHLIMGHDHKFGKDRQGDFTYLKGFEKQIRVEQLEAETYKGEIISSQRIRDCLRVGKVDEVEENLGRPYELHGKVVKGQQRGQEIGYPTANLEVSTEKCLPGDGIYVVGVRCRGKDYEAMLYSGEKQVVHRGSRGIEVHLFNFREDIYGEELKIFFFGYLREDRSFDSWTALRDQLDLDKQDALAFFENRRKRSL